MSHNPGQEPLDPAPEGREGTAGEPSTDRPRRRGLWIGAGILIVIVAAVALSRPGKPGEGGRAGGKGRPAAPIPVVAAVAKIGDMPVYLTGLGTVTRLQPVTVKRRVDGQIVRIAFEEGQIVERGRPAGRDRPAAVPGAARAGGGPDGARPRPARRGEAHPRAQPRPPRPGHHRRAAARRPGGGGRAVRGRRADRPGADRRRKLQLTYSASRRRSAAASGSVWSTSATSCTPTTRAGCS